MWMLKKVQTGETYYVTPKEIHIVGRLTGDLVLAEDKSISRIHAHIKITKKEKIFVIDCNSTYGTYKNEGIDQVMKLESNTPILLEDGDLVQFGRLGNMWKVSHAQLKTTTSVLTSSQMTDLVKDLKNLDATISKAWSIECTHLTMCTISITLKLLQALVSCIPIVSPKYWKDGFKSFNNYKEYCPPFSEPYINSKEVDLTINKNRNSLFLKKKFVFFLDNHLNMFKDIIHLAGGNCVSLDKTKITKSEFLKDNIIVVQSNSSMSKDQVQDNLVKEYIKKKGERIIPDSEIGLAIIYCSTIKHCNPKFNTLLNFKAVDESEKSYEILAPNTDNTAVTIVQDVTSSSTKEIQETQSTNEDELMIIEPEITTRTNLKRSGAIISPPPQKKKHLEPAYEIEMDFSLPQKQTVTRISHIKQKRNLNEINENDLFAFDDNIEIKSKRRKEMESKKNNETNKSVSQSQSLSKIIKKLTVSDDVFLNSVKPLEVTADGWSIKGNNTSLSVDLKPIHRSDETKLWIESIKNVFEVRRKPISELIVDNDLPANEISINKNVKNFKTFVKQKFIRHVKDL